MTDTDPQPTGLARATAAIRKNLATAGGPDQHRPAAPVGIASTHRKLTGLALARAGIKKAIANL